MLFQSTLNGQTFVNGLEPQILASCHVNPLNGFLDVLQTPSVVIQGAYVSSPPVLSRSFVIRWADPFLSSQA